MNNIYVLYAVENCPKCNILKKRLHEKNIDYEIGDIHNIMGMGFLSAPILQINEKYLTFGQSIHWLNDNA